MLPVIRPLITLAIAAFLILSSGTVLAQTDTTSVTMTVDFNSAIGPANQKASGILHSFYTTEPPDKYVKPLKLKNFRGRAADTYLLAPGFYDRLVSLGVEHIQVVLSDNHGYGMSWGGWPPGDNGWWEFIIEDAVKKIQAKKMVVEYDIWNEPNIGYFWAKTQAEWFETWRRGYVKLHSLEPNAITIGPSVSGFNFTYITDFLIYARANNCLPDIISWHELGSSNGRAIPAHVQQIKDWLTSNSININRFSINEIIPASQAIPKDYHDSPGTAIAYFAGISRTSVESACRSCWGDNENGVSGDNGENRSLDGLLTYQTKQPRSTWWAYKAYADLNGEFVTIDRAATSTNLDGLACRNAANSTAQVVIGSYETTKALNVNLQLQNLNMVPYLQNDNSLFVVIERLNYSGKSPSTGPEQIYAGPIPVSGSSADIFLPALGAKSVYIVRFTPVASVNGSWWNRLGDNWFCN